MILRYFSETPKIGYKLFVPFEKLRNTQLKDTPLDFRYKNNVPHEND